MQKIAIKVYKIQTVDKIELGEKTQSLETKTQ